jgi:hypothetical protein
MARSRCGHCEVFVASIRGLPERVNCSGHKGRAEIHASFTEFCQGNKTLKSQSTCFIPIFSLGEMPSRRTKTKTAEEMNPPPLTNTNNISELIF